MGFIESYIIIFFLGFSCHFFVKNKRPANKELVAWWSALSILIPLLIDVLIYVGAFNWLWNALSNAIPWYSVENGKDFMFNIFLGFRIGNIPTDSSGLNAIATVFFLSYTAWFVFAKDGSRMLYGQKAYQEGYWWALSPIRKPKDWKEEANKKIRKSEK
ncbi:MAG: hypothetical protein GF364_09980 [Candidatus Lokiarchaeota archaeon]|nr:hypothetical protein [Candidatus Lokiarchaeota archaeon]